VVSVVVAIDIKPGSAVNSVNPASQGVLPVAILGSADFDVTSIDFATVRFGKNGTEAPPVRAAFEDVNGDGILDAILQFTSTQTGIVCGTTSATLKGQTTGGIAFSGSDFVNTVSCKR